MAQQPDISEVLNSLSKEELIRIILQAADQDDIFKKGLLVKYAQGDHTEQLQLCRKLMDSIVDKHVERNGFIPYRETYNFARDMSNLLEEADEARDNGLVSRVNRIFRTPLGKSVFWNVCSL